MPRSQKTPDMGIPAYPTSVPPKRASENYGHQVQ
jgi:hypothetical protein